MTVDDIIAGIIKREGGYVNNPNDRGGPTNYGITEFVARSFGYNGPIKTMPKATAEKIYRERYWDAPKFSIVAQTMPKLAVELMDTGVNMGQSTAAKMVQRALNVLNQRALQYPDLTVDGQLGKMSFFALNAFAKRRGVDIAEKVLIRMVEAQQAVRYMEIAEANPSQEEFMYGWILNRVGDFA